MKNRQTHQQTHTYHQKTIKNQKHQWKKSRVPSNNKVSIENIQDSFEKTIMPTEKHQNPYKQNKYPRKKHHNPAKKTINAFRWKTFSIKTTRFLSNYTSTPLFRTRRGEPGGGKPSPLYLSLRSTHFSLFSTSFFLFVKARRLMWNVTSTPLFRTRRRKPGALYPNLRSTRLCFSRHLIQKEKTERSTPCPPKGDGNPHQIQTKNMEIHQTRQQTHTYRQNRIQKPNNSMKKTPESLQKTILAWPLAQGVLDHVMIPCPMSPACVGPEQPR